MKTTDWYKIISFCKPYFQKTWLTFGTILGIIAVGAAVSNSMPLLWGRIIDCLAGANFKQLAKNLLLYFGATAVVYMLGVIEGYVGAKLNFEIESRIRKEVFDKILHMNCSDLDEVDTGELVSRVSSDSGSVISFAINTLATILTILINICAALVFSFQISSELSVVAIAFIPLSVILNCKFKGAYRSLGERQKKHADKMSSFLVSVLGHVPDIKAYSMERQQNEKYKELLEESWVLQKKGYILSNESSAMSSLIASTSAIVTIIMSALFVGKGRLTIGNVVSFQSYIEKLKASVTQLLQMNYSAQAACISIDRIREVYEKATDETDVEEGVLQISNIRFDRVSFAYRGKSPVLNEISFNIDSPGVYAFVGENGCGKTTILKLLMRYYHIESGSISINQQDMTTLSTGSIRNSIGYYAKNVYIQNASLKENLLLGAKHSLEDTVPENVIIACKKVGLTDLIDQLPNCYDTEVREDGKILSSGQKQKIAVVRAMQSKASVILFDEITSDLDGTSEKNVCDVLDALGRTKIVVLVTHRVNSACRAKQIMVVENGCITAAGTHCNLLKFSKEYRRLFEQQEKELLN